MPPDNSDPSNLERRAVLVSALLHPIVEIGGERFVRIGEVPGYGPVLVRIEPLLDALEREG